VKWSPRPFEFTVPGRRKIGGAIDCEITKLFEYTFRRILVAAFKTAPESVTNWKIISAPDRNFGALSFMNTNKDNLPQTPAIPDAEDWSQTLDCLDEWLKAREPCEEKPHKVLRALTQETRKKIGKDAAQRRFTARELAAATGENPPDATKWLNWKNAVERYWNTRSGELIDLARCNGVRFFPSPRRNSTAGGPGNEATYELEMLPLPFTETQPQNSIVQPAGQADTIIYEVTNPNQIKLSWWARIIFHKGQARMGTWRSRMIIGWVMTMLVMTMLVSVATYLALLTPRPLTSKDLAALFSVVALPLGVWILVLQPWYRLLNDRIVGAAESILSWREKHAQLELFTDRDTRQIRVVRYSSTCATCGAAVYVDDGSPDFPRRMIGRCSESPREHVFSFDRVTRSGEILR